MDILVFGGSGKIGAAIAWDLVKANDVAAVGILGRRENALSQTKAWIGSPKVKMHPLDVADEEALVDLMRRYDVGVIALLDRKTSYRVVEMALEARLHLVDMLDEYHRRPALHEVEGLETPDGMEGVLVG